VLSLDHQSRLERVPEVALLVIGGREVAAWPGVSGPASEQLFVRGNRFLVLVSEKEVPSVDLQRFALREHVALRESELQLRLSLGGAPGVSQRETQCRASSREARVELDRSRKHRDGIVDLTRRMRGATSGELVDGLDGFTRSRVHPRDFIARRPV
jgi:hypothetical protein